MMKQKLKEILFLLKKHVYEFKNFIINPIMLKGPTGTSKTKTIQVLCDLQNLELIRINLSSETAIEDLMGRLVSNKDNSLSDLYKEGKFAEAYSKGKVLLLDEVNLEPNPILQCMLIALDSDKITQSVPGIGYF